MPAVLYPLIVSVKGIWAYLLFSPLRLLYKNIYLFVHLKASGYALHLSDHLPLVESLIIQPNNTSAVQPMHTAFTANIKAH